MVTGIQLKDKIKASGLSQREIARQLGYSWTHFNFVLNNKRQSRTLFQAVLDLLARQAPQNNEQNEKWEAE